MPEQAGEVINDILLEIVVLGADAEMDPSETASTMRYINRFMAMLAAKGINLGFTTLTSVSDTLTIADGAIIGLIKNVAKLIAPQYGAVVTLELQEAARDGLDAMRRLGTSITPSQMPCTLPRGSGNDHDTNDNKFYNCPADQILTETDRNILLEDDT
jgi:hypothetical protein